MNTRSVVLVLLVASLLAGQAPVGAQEETMHVLVNGAELSYVEDGLGPTVVFVHGAFGDWRNWEGLRPLIAQRYRFVSLSLRYHYPNAWSDKGENYSIAQHVEDVAQFIRQLNVGKVHLVGSSFGGRLVGYVALKYPDLLRSLVMGEPSIISPDSAAGKATLAAFQKDSDLSAAAAKSGDEKQAAILLYDAILDDPSAFQKAPTATQLRILDNANTLPLYWARSTRLPVSCEQLASLKVPVLVVRGENTRANFVHANNALLSCLPKTTATVTIPGASHTWYTINPEAAQAVLSFIDQH